MPIPGRKLDVAFALTEGREPINPRPIAEAHICRWHQPYTIGSITYSEGCNDDVNKAIWSALEWDPKADVKEILMEYSRYFISPRFEEKFAEGLLELERNWGGLGINNSQIDDTSTVFQEIEDKAGPKEKLNWRFQQALYRARYDKFIRDRATFEANAVKNAILRLTEEPRLGVNRAISAAIDELSNPTFRKSAYRASIREPIFRLAEALFNAIRMQLSVKRYNAIAVWRGANLDSIDTPIGNTESSSDSYIESLIRWTRSNAINSFQPW